MNYDTWKSTNPADNELGRSTGTPTPWHCLNCEATGKGVMAQAAHWRQTQHMCRFGKRPDVWATYCFDQPDFKGGAFAMYLVHGGQHDRSTVTAETLTQLGIEVRK